MTLSHSWPAVAAAQAHAPERRVPFVVNGRPVGSVARAHLQALRDAPPPFAVDAESVRCDANAATLSTVLAARNAALRATGLILAWRDEPFPLLDPATQQPLATIERAACRFWGTLTLGAHASGYRADERGRPTHLWLAQRAADKATDPGLLDNLIGGGVPVGQTPLQALVREGWEEAGLHAQQLRCALPASRLYLQREVREGLQLELLHAFDLPLPAGFEPRNQDGEVAGFRCVPVAEAVELAAGDAMTVDAALVTLDFALRHRLLPPTQARVLERQLRALRRSTGPG